MASQSSQPSTPTMSNQQSESLITSLGKSSIPLGAAAVLGASASAAFSYWAVAKKHQDLKNLKRNKKSSKKNQTIEEHQEAEEEEEEKPIEQSEEEDHTPRLASKVWLSFMMRFCLLTHLFLKSSKH
jgi:uncharacterized membrane protein YdbT with pleckstrin-like domain